MLKIPEQFDSRFVRVVAGVIVPGAVALIPWLLVTSACYPGVGEWLFKNAALPNATLVLLVFCVGMVCENLGSRLEVHLEQENEAHGYAWREYLTQPKDHLVGHGYISSLVTRLKFELGMFVALIAAIPGIAALAFCLAAMPARAGTVLLALGAVGILYFFWEANTSVNSLARTRLLMAKGSPTNACR
jgi:hypothetical protein